MTHRNDEKQAKFDLLIAWSRKNIFFWTSFFIGPLRYHTIILRNAIENISNIFYVYGALVTRLLRKCHPDCIVGLTKHMTRPSPQKEVILDTIMIHFQICKYGFIKIDLSKVFIINLTILILRQLNFLFLRAISALEMVVALLILSWSDFFDYVIMICTFLLELI